MVLLNTCKIGAAYCYKVKGFQSDPYLPLGLKFVYSFIRDISLSVKPATEGNSYSAWFDYRNSITFSSTLDGSKVKQLFIYINIYEPYSLRFGLLNARSVSKWHYKDREILHRFLTEALHPLCNFFSRSYGFWFAAYRYFYTPCIKNCCQAKEKIWLVKLF